MIKVYQKFSKTYKRMLAEYARKKWRGDKASFSDYEDKVRHFANRYKRELQKYYKEKDIKIYPGTIEEKTEQWFADQKNIFESVDALSQLRKEKLTAAMFERWKKSRDADVQKILNKVFLDRSDIARGAQVYKVYDFSDALGDSVERIADNAAFDLARDTNTQILSDLDDRFMWQTQEDARVRPTHRRLNKKVFLFSDPPTTVDRYGHTHTGLPGTDYNCRCYALPAPSGKKPLKNYVARE